MISIIVLVACSLAYFLAWLVGWMAGWLVDWLVGRVRAQSRGCTRAALTHGSVVAAAQCGAGANSGHGIGHRNMFHFFRVACDAQGRGVIIQAHTYNVAAVRGKSARCARARHLSCDARVDMIAKCSHTRSLTRRRRSTRRSQCSAVRCEGCGLTRIIARPARCK